MTLDSSLPGSQETAKYYVLLLLLFIIIYKYILLVLSVLS
jgi:hypothetical protein